MDAAELVSRFASTSPRPKGPAAFQPARDRLARRPTGRRFHDGSKAKAARDALRELPGPGETHHHLMSGSYDGFDLVDAIAGLAGCGIAELRLATLGFNAANAQRLAAMLEAGSVARCTMLVSAYYKSDPAEAHVCDSLARELPKYGTPAGWFAVARSHAKIIAARMADGRCFTIESSANLRSCRCVEQFTLAEGADVFAFHAAWMDELRATLAQDEPQGGHDADAPDLGGPVEPGDLENTTHATEATP